MKRKLFIIMLAASVTMCGCGKKDTVVNEQANELTEEANKEEANEATTSDVVSEDDNDDVNESDVTVKEQYSNEGSYEVSYGEGSSFECSFSYHIPKLVDESEDAAKINNEIKNYTKDSVETVESQLAGTADDSYEPEYIDVSYKAYENGDIISLCVQAASPYSDWVDYLVYNYNKATHKMIANDELLGIVGIAEDDFVAYARRTLGNISIKFVTDQEEYFAESEEEENEYTYTPGRMIADVANFFVQTVSDENVNKDMMMYLDDDGDMCIVGFVNVPAGAGRYYSNTKLDMTSKELDTSRFMELANKYHYPEFEKNSLELYEVEGFSGTLVHDVASGNQYEDEVYIGFDDKDASIFCMQLYGDGFGIAYTGSLEFVGMDQNGLMYNMILNNKDGEPFSTDEEPIESTFYLRPFDSYNNDTDEYKSGVIYHYVDGIDMLDSNGEEIELTRSFG